MPPAGRLLVAVNDSDVCGCIALSKLTNTICEMRTLFVQPEYRGQGIGRQLATTLIGEARSANYRQMRLDTLRFMNSAYQLYRSQGFHEIAAYRDLPEDMKPYIRFMQHDL